MTALTAPGGRSLLGKAQSALQARKRPKSARAAVAMAVARQHVVTVAALVSVDLGAFHVPWGLGPAVGFIVTGVSLLAADFAVRG